MANLLPLNTVYHIASSIADAYCYASKSDKAAVISNLKIVLKGEPKDERLMTMARDVFRNFAKYLADFFRFPKVDSYYIKRFVKVEGLKNIDEALSKGKGAIMLSAHIGNWELGGFVLAMLGYPLSAVVLTHQNKRINDFFTRQRRLSQMKPIEIGISLRECYATLKNNRLLALLGDRDFSKNGIYADFFGKETLIPKGPSVFSYKFGSAIVPSFMIREKDDTFRLVFEEPICPDPSESEEKAAADLTRKYLAAIESYIKRYPTQWYMFRNVWGDDKRLLRPDTII